MMHFCQGSCWQPPQTASHIHIGHIQSDWAHWSLICYPWAYSISLTQLYPPYLEQILGLWVTCGVKMMGLCHGWGWQPPQTASHTHMRHSQSIWVHWYTVHWHMVAALHSFTHPTWCRFVGFWVTCGVKMMWLCHGWGWQPPQTASHIHIRHVQSVWVHWYTVHWHTVAALHSFTHPTWRRFVGFWVTVIGHCIVAGNITC